MKRINYAGDSLITSDGVARALLEYATHSRSNVTIDIPVLEGSGKVAMHTVLIGPSSQLDVFDVDGLSPEKEAELFPLPELPSIGGKARATNLAAEDVAPMVDVDGAEGDEASLVPTDAAPVTVSREAKRR